VAAKANSAGGDNNDQPSYVLRDIPPTGELKLDSKFAQVYFGEALSGYAVVDTKVPEQEAVSDTPTSTPSSYTGAAGIPVSSFLRKGALALRFGDWNLFVSGQVTSKSRVIFHRAILDRVQTAAPFLKFDADPYPVVVQNRIVWVIDGYTTTNNYPYSQSIHPRGLAGSGLDTTFNYVRNSVKATVDAYDGTIKFYVIDPTDPIIHTYTKAFPEMFTDATKLPAELQPHLRYPEDMFRAQTEQYTLYHITDPVQYFNKQDIWDITPTPDTPNATPGTTQAVGGNNGGRNTTLPPSGSPANPLYLTMQLPGESKPEFLLERSFTPRRKNGILSSFIFARSDPGHYGELMVFTLGNADAPSATKAASAIESDSFISQQFSLLDQRGSKVEKGDVELLPIGNAVLYVRPMWITGQSDQPYPRYRFTAAVSGDRAVLGDDINDAVTALLTGKQTALERRVRSGVDITNLPNQGGNNTPSTSTTTTVPNTGTTVKPSNQTADQLEASALSELQAADTARQAGDLGGYQEHVSKALEDLAAAQAKRNGSTTSTTAP
jgi:uncharacterized membrane protein (UPF0182 family)